MSMDFVWMEGLPDEVRIRAKDAITDVKVAMQCCRENPGCPVAAAALAAALTEGEDARALLREWYVDDRKVAA